MKKTLVFLAAGIGSRFGKGIKQLEPVGPNGEVIIDYSIHDAIAAGFNKIVFIIRHDIEDAFREVIGNRIEKICKDLNVEVCYAFQEKENIPGTVPEGRIKPWGTGHAVLACDGILNEPFAVINSDDYYGADAFVQAAKFLETNSSGLVGYILKNTLSDNGGVTRGICKVDNGKLLTIRETKNIVRNGLAAEANGEILDLESLVSMNFWCLPASFMNVLKDGFPQFLKGMKDPLKDEYLLPIIVDDLLKKGTEVSVLRSNDQWFGVTYQEDKASVVEAFKKLYKDGKYSEKLYSDLV